MPLFFKTTAGLFAIGLLPALALWLAAPQLFAWLFGPQWFMAGEFARYLAVWLLFAFCNLPAVLFARLIRIQRTVFFYNLALLAARVLALVVGGLYLSALQSIIWYSVVGALMNLMLILLVRRALLRQQGRDNSALLRGALAEHCP